MKAQRNLVDILRRPARLVPAKTAVVDASEHALCPRPHRYSWSDVAQRVGATAQLLRSRGVGAAERVGVLSTNSHYYFELFFAVPLAQGFIVPLNYRLADEELIAQLEEARPLILVADSRFYDRACSLQSFVPSIDEVISTESEEWEGAIVQYRAGLDEEALSAQAHRKRRGDRSDDDNTAFVASEDDPVGIFYTGGASGRAKGVVLTHRNLYDATVQICLAMGYIESDVYLHAGPMFHLADAAGSLSCTLLGATHVFIPSFDPDRFVDAVERFGVTTATMVPTMYRMLLDSNSFDPSKLTTLRRMYFSAAPMSEATIKEIFEALPCGIGQGYGMTEASSRISVMPPEIYRGVIEGSDPRRHLLSSAGREVPGLEVRVLDGDGIIARPGEVGEIVVSGSVVMKGYWMNPELTEQALRGDWLHTGDLGYRDEDGYLYLVDRIKDMIITGGENVYSLEVENVLNSHPDVAEAAVIGIRDVLWGERVHAVVVPRPGKSLSEEEVRSYCRSRIASYKAPKSVEFVAALPRSAAGKVLKDELKRRIDSQP